MTYHATGTVRAVVAVLALVVLVGVGACGSRSGGGGTALPAVSPLPRASAVSRPRHTAAPAPRWQVRQGAGTSGRLHEALEIRCDQGAF